MLAQFISTAASGKLEITNSCLMIARNCIETLTSGRYFMVGAGSWYFADKSPGVGCGIRNKQT